MTGLDDRQSTILVRTRQARLQQAGNVRLRIDVIGLIAAIQPPAVLTV